MQKLVPFFLSNKIFDKIFKTSQRTISISGNYNLSDYYDNNKNKDMIFIDDFVILEELILKKF